MEDGPPRIEVDTFDLGIPPEEIVEERHVGVFRGRKRTIVKRFRQVGGIKTPITLHNLMEEPHQIDEKDILGVCVLLVRRRL